MNDTLNYDTVKAEANFILHSNTLTSKKNSVFSRRNSRMNCASERRLNTSERPDEDIIKRTDKFMSLKIQVQ